MKSFQVIQFIDFNQIVQEAQYCSAKGNESETKIISCISQSQSEKSRVTNDICD